MWVAMLLEMNVSIYLKGPVCKIGRSADNDISFNHDKSISRNHAELHVNLNGLTLVDLGSKFGTFLENVKISPKTSCVLVDGQLVQFGVFNTRVKIIKETPLICTSSLDKLQRDILRANVRLLGARVTQIVEDADYVICGRFAATMKMLTSIVLKKVIVTLDWLGFLNTANATAVLPSTDSVTSDFLKADHVVDPEISRATLLKRFVVILLDNRDADYKILLTACGATVVMYADMAKADLSAPNETIHVCAFFDQSRTEAPEQAEQLEGQTFMGHKINWITVAQLAASIMFANEPVPSQKKPELVAGERRSSLSQMTRMSTQQPSMSMNMSIAPYISAPHDYSLSTRDDNKRGRSIYDANKNGSNENRNQPPLEKVAATYKRKSESPLVTAVSSASPSSASSHLLKAGNGDVSCEPFIVEKTPAVKNVLAGFIAKVMPAVDALSSSSPVPASSSSPSHKRPRNEATVIKNQSAPAADTTTATSTATSTTTTTTAAATCLIDTNGGSPASAKDGDAFMDMLLEDYGSASAAKMKPSDMFYPQQPSRQFSANTFTKAAESLPRAPILAVTETRTPQSMSEAPAPGSQPAPDERPLDYHHQESADELISSRSTLESSSTSVSQRPSLLETEDGWMIPFNDAEKEKAQRRMQLARAAIIKQQMTSSSNQKSETAKLEEDNFTDVRPSSSRFPVAMKKEQEETPQREDSCFPLEGPGIVETIKFRGSNGTRESFRETSSLPETAPAALAACVRDFSLVSRPTCLLRYIGNGFRKNFVRSVRDKYHKQDMDKVLPKESEQEIKLRKEMRDHAAQEEVAELMFSERFGGAAVTTSKVGGARLNRGSTYH